MSVKLIRWFDKKWKPERSQAELATALGISESYLSLLMNGHKPWTLTLAIKLEKLSKRSVKPSDLMEAA